MFTPSYFSYVLLGRIQLRDAQNCQIQDRLPTKVLLWRSNAQNCQILNWFRFSFDRLNAPLLAVVSVYRPYFLTN